MKYREKVNKNVKKREIWKLLPWQQQIHHDYIITFFGEYHNHTSYNILTFNFDMLELSLYPIYNGATSTISTCILVRKG